MHEPASEAAPILVLGATGRHGGTGSIVVDRLLRHGSPLRALVHTEDEPLFAADPYALAATLGRAPIHFADFVRSHLSHFGAAPATTSR